MPRTLVGRALGLRWVFVGRRFAPVDRGTVPGEGEVMEETMEIRGMVDEVFDYAEMVREGGGPIRHCVALGPEREIVLESPYPPMEWWWGPNDFPRFPEKERGEIRMGPSWVVAIANPDELAAWKDREDLLYLCSRNGDEPVYVDLVTSMPEIAMWWGETLSPPGEWEPSKARTRAQMHREGLHLVKALKAWDEGDDSQLSERCLRYAESVLRKGSRAEVKLAVGRDT